jgi:hypothetical protein
MFDRQNVFLSGGANALNATAGLPPCGEQAAIMRPPADVGCK